MEEEIIGNRDVAVEWPNKKKNRFRSMLIVLLNNIYVVLFIKGRIVLSV